MTGELKKYVARPLYRKLRKEAPDAAEFLLGVLYRVRAFFFRLFHSGSLSRTAPGILIDVTNVSIIDGGTGIQRVVNRISEEIAENFSGAIAVRDVGGQLYTSFSYIKRCGGSDAGVNFLSGDALLLLDSSWKFHRDFLGIIRSAKTHGARVFAVAYDLIPIKHPELCADEGFNKIFKIWHDMVLSESDGVICISRPVADDVESYFEKMKFRREDPLKIFSIHMGADITRKSADARDSLKEFVSRRPTFLMVGTVEPRKGYDTALAAFEKLRGKTDAQLLIIGRDGWKNDALKKRIESLGGCVMWTDDAKDEELQWCYQRVSALIAASIDEGFGLPIIEAAYFGLPVIASDIPIFREVTAGHADFFTVQDADELAVCVEKWLAAKEHPDPRKIPIHTWQDSAREIISILNGNTEPYKILQ